jgi:cob(I)alamin adenosyltransferase
MSFENFKKKESVVVVYTGDSKGKTSASLGMTVRALGADWRVAYVQFIKHWEVSEHKFFAKIAPLYGEKFVFYKGGKGFYNAGDMSAKNVSADEHHIAAQATFDFALDCATSGTFDLVVCDEINNAAHDGLISKEAVQELIQAKHSKTSLCLTGRNFPDELLPLCDIVTEMKKIKHHFDEEYIANVGIDY